MNNKRIHELLGIIKRQRKLFNKLEPIGTRMAILETTDPLYEAVQFLLEEDIKNNAGRKFCEEHQENCVVGNEIGKRVAICLSCYQTQLETNKYPDALQMTKSYWISINGPESKIEETKE